MPGSGNNHHADLSTVDRAEVVEPLRFLPPNLGPVSFATAVENGAVAALDANRRGNPHGESGLFLIAEVEVAVVGFVLGSRYLAAVLRGRV